MKRPAEAGTPVFAHPVKNESIQSPEFDCSNHRAVENVNMINIAGKPSVKNFKRCIATPAPVKPKMSAGEVAQEPESVGSYIGKIRLVGNFKVSPNSAFDPFTPDQATVKNSTTR